MNSKEFGLFLASSAEDSLKNSKLKLDRYREWQQKYSNDGDEFLQVKLLSKEAYLPYRATEFAAGFDLFAPREVVVNSNQTLSISLDIEIRVPEGCYARIAPRSSNSLNYVIVNAGVVDRDFFGNVSVILHNLHPTNLFTVQKGHAIAQLVLEKISYAKVKQVKVFNDELPNVYNEGMMDINDNIEEMTKDFIKPYKCKLCSNCSFIK